MKSTDVLLVHSGYSKYRRELLESSVNLFELKRALETQADKASGIVGSSAGLHAKSFAVDNNRIFIGSFNFDPRSVHFNCEMGYLIYSEALANQLKTSFDGVIKKAAYQPLLTPEDKMVWQETSEEGKTVIYQEEPETNWFEQTMMVFFGLLPIEWML